MTAGMEAMHGLSNMHFHSPVLTGLWPLPRAQSASSRDQRWAPYMTPGWSSGYLVENWLHWTVSIMEGPELCSCSNSHLVWIWICLLAHNDSAQTTICGLIECFIHHHSIPHSTASDQGTRFIANEMQQWTYAHRIHWSYHVPHCPQSAGLTLSKGDYPR